MIKSLAYQLILSSQVSTGLIIARVECVLWPPSRFGRLPPRPHFDLDKALSRRRAKEQNEGYWLNLISKRAHPEDSTISPYSDWEWNTTASVKGNSQRDVEEETRRPAGRVSKSQKVDGDDDGRLALWRDRWNQMSRGGQLGRDARREEDS